MDESVNESYSWVQVCFLLISDSVCAQLQQSPSYRHVTSQPSHSPLHRQRTLPRAPHHQPNATPHGKHLAARTSINSPAVMQGLPQASNNVGFANGIATGGLRCARTDNSFFTLTTLQEASENEPTQMVQRANSGGLTAAGWPNASVPPPARPSRETRHRNIRKATL